MTIFESFSFRAEISEGHAKCTQDRLRGHRTQKGLDGRNVYRKESLSFLTASLRVWGGGECTKRQLIYFTISDSGLW